mmetsp:Transcript_67605/g.213924  ORF Transcript_67605/g.213924 Transcript_67605/m.213924 type:complete len:244 (+) Transcript_67605:474-1205(+)
MDWKAPKSSSSSALAACGPEGDGATGVSGAVTQPSSNSEPPLAARGTWASSVCTSGDRPWFCLAPVGSLGFKLAGGGARMPMRPSELSFDCSWLLGWWATPFRLTVIFCPSFRERSAAGACGSEGPAAAALPRSPRVDLKSPSATLKSKETLRSSKPRPMKACRSALVILITKYLLESTTGSTYFSCSPPGMRHCAKSVPLLLSMSLTNSSAPLPTTLHVPWKMHVCQSSALCPLEEAAGGIL